MIPNRVDERLRPHLEEIAKLRRDFESFRALRTGASDPEQDEEEIAALEASEHAVSSATTLYNESVAGGSIIGEPLLRKNRTIYDWIEDAEAIETVAERPYTHDTTLPSLSVRLDKQVPPVL